MKFFRIKNYEKYQGVRSGDCKPWIKLFKKLRHDWAYGQLHDSHKAAFIHLLLTADEVSNQFPCDSRALRKQLVLNSYVKIEVFEKVGLIEEIVTPKNGSLREDKNRLEENRREKKKEKPVVCMKTLRNNFEEDWKTYPKKNGANKAKAFECYKRTVGINLRLSFSVKSQDYIDSFNGDTTYMKNAETWFRNWEGIEVDPGKVLKPARAGNESFKRSPEHEARIAEIFKNAEQENDV